MLESSSASKCTVNNTGNDLITEMPAQRNTSEKHSMLFKNFSFDERLKNRVKISEGYRNNLSLDEECCSNNNRQSRKFISKKAQVNNKSNEPGDRKILRDALYEGIFKKHRSAIFALGSFVRMLKNRNSQYDTIQNNVDGEDS